MSQAVKLVTKSAFLSTMTPQKVLKTIMTKVSDIMYSERLFKIINPYAAGG